MPKYIPSPRLRKFVSASARMTFEEKVHFVSDLNKKEMEDLFLLSGPVKNWRESLLHSENQKAPKTFTGKNSLPFFSSFEKCFFSVGRKIYGFNSSWIGKTLAKPGYFEIVELSTGELLFDYMAEFPNVALNKDAFPSSTFEKNENFLFGDLIDLVREVGPGVLIGEAIKIKNGKLRPLGIYFTLIKQLREPEDYAHDIGIQSAHRILDGQTISPETALKDLNLRVSPDEDLYLRMLEAYAEAQHKVLINNVQNIRF